MMPSPQPYNAKLQLRAFRAKLRAFQAKLRAFRAHAIPSCGFLIQILEGRLVTPQNI